MKVFTKKYMINSVKEFGDVDFLIDNVEKVFPNEYCSKKEKIKFEKFMKTVYDLTLKSEQMIIHKDAINLFNIVNKKFGFNFDIKPFLEKFEKRALFLKEYEYYLSSNIEFYQEGLINIKELEDRFENLQYDENDPNFKFDEIIREGAKLALLPGINFEKVEDIIAKNLRQVLALSLQEKNRENDSLENNVFFSFDVAYKNFILLNPNRIHMEKFKTIFKQDEICPYTFSSMEKFKEEMSK